MTHTQRDSLGPLALMAAIVAGVLLLYACVAHADPAAAPAPASSPPGLDWPTIVALALGALAGARVIVDALLAFFKMEAPLTKNTIDDEVRDSLQLAHDKLDGLSATVLKLTSSISAPVVAPRNQQAGRARLAAMVAIGLIGAALAGAAMIGCATTKPALAAGTIAALDCELADIKPADLTDATALATATVQHWLAGGVAASTAAIRADLAPFKSDLAKCALAGSLALATTALTPTPGTATQGLSTAAALDPLQLRAAFGSAAHLLGWPPVKVASGEIL